MARSYLHTIKSVDFQIEGLGFLDVTSFSMTLEPGTIPMAQIGVVLAGGGKKATKKNRSMINPFSLGTLNDRLNMLVALAAKSQTCNFRLQMDTTRLTDGKTGGQDILLKGWILVSAGLGTLSTTNSFSCVCTIAHPAYKLTMHGGFCTNFNESLKLEELAPNVEDPISAGVTVYERIQEVEEKLKFIDDGSTVVPGGKTPNEIMEDVESVFKKIPELLKQYIEWSPKLGGGSGGIPFKDVLSDKLLLATQQLMLECWIPSGSYSVWDIFISSVCGEFDLTVIPDYTKEKLPVCPYFPWMVPTLELNEDDLFELSFPGTDPAPIYGLCSSPQMEAINDQYPSTYTEEESENLDDQATTVAYVPVANADINGKFFTGSIPEWLSSAIQIAPGLNSQDIDPSSMASDTSSEDVSSGDNEEMKSANSLKMHCLAYQFLKEFKKRLEATINCPLLISRNGEDPFLPGSVLSVKNSDGVLLEGYVVSLTHTIDMASGSGSTSMHLAYCRPESGYEVTKEVLDKNPMYS